MGQRCGTRVDVAHQRRVDDVLHRSVEHDLALVQHDHARADLADEIEIVFDQHARTSGGRARAPAASCRSACARAWSARPSARRAAGCSVRARAPSPARAPASARARAAGTACRARPAARWSARSRARRAAERSPRCASTRRGRTRRIRETASASSTVSSSNTFAVWNLRPMPRRTHAYGGRRPISWPFSSMCPLVRSAPSLTQRISVVLPAPFGPTSESSSPCRASKVTLRSTLRLPKLFATAAILQRELAAARKARERFLVGDQQLSLCNQRSCAAPEQARDRRQQALRHHDDHEHERDAEDQLPDKRQVAAEIGRAEVDHQRAEHRPQHRAAAAERDPDDQFGAELEADHLGRHHHAVARIDITGHRADARQRDHQHDLHARRVEPEVFAARFVLADRHQQASGVAAHETQRGQCGEQQKPRGDPEPGADIEIETFEPRQAAARTGERAAGEDHLRGDDRQHQRDHRCIQWRGTRIERQRADECGDDHADRDAAQRARAPPSSG